MNILLVDDETDTQFLFESFFRKEIKDKDYIFSFAANGKEAMSLYEKGKFDIILTDLNMPIMSGVELIKRVKSEDPDQVVVILTAYDNKQHRDFSESFQNINFFPKPIDFNDLKVVLSQFHENLAQS